jgi:transcriptional regulator with XRE-family HTH domain
VALDKKNQQYFKQLGAALRRLRTEKGWSLYEAEENGFHDWKYLQKVESGRNITIATLLKLADLYGKKPWEILKEV